MCHATVTLQGLVAGEAIHILSFQRPEDPGYMTNQPVIRDLQNLELPLPFP